MEETKQYLEEPIDIDELLRGGTSFSLLGGDNQDDFNLYSDDEVDDEDDIEIISSPWTKPYDELKKKMMKINDYIFKKVEVNGDKKQPTVPKDARVRVRYSGYFEGETSPFDSSYIRKNDYEFCTGTSEVLEGLELAVCSMRPNEVALFIISYKLLYGELGCPPRIKPRADALFKVEVISYNLLGDMDAINKMAKEDRNKFALVFENVKLVHLKGIDYFKQNNKRGAIKAFETAVNALSFCQLANEEEERTQTAFLVKLHVNLANCYNMMEQYGKSCINIKEVKRLTNNKPSAKALFHEGRALFNLGDYENALTSLLNAAVMEPENKQIRAQLKDVDERLQRYKKDEKEIWTRAMGIKNLKI